MIAETAPAIIMSAAFIAVNVVTFVLAWYRYGRRV